MAHITKNIGVSNVLFGMETTGHYWYAIFLAASCCSFHDNPLNDYYKKKRSQGKHHLSEVGAMSNKLTTMIYAVPRYGKPYDAKKFV